MATDLMKPRADPRRWYALGLLCTAAFMVILDSQIVILALPSITKDLALSAGAGQWVMSAYLLAFGGLMLLGGRLADLLGRRRVFIVGTALFLVASLLCGLAWAGGVLIAARVLQGVSAAVMTPTALSILMTTFPEGPERNKALAIWSALGGTGATAALLIGGPVTSWLGWEWIFFINLPVAAGLLALSPVLLRESRDRAVTAVDFGGAATVTGALTLLIYGVVTAPTTGWLSAPALGPLLGSVVLAALFVVLEKRSAAPLVPLRIFGSRTFAGGNLAMLLVGMTAFGMSIVISEYAQQVLGYSPLAFGGGTAVMTVMTIVGSYVAQAMVGRIGVRPVMVGAFLLLGVGCLLLAQVTPDGTYFGDIFWGLLVFGPGLGGGAVAASIAALSGAAEQDSGLASGFNTAAFQIGGAIGVAVVSTVAVSFTAGPTPRAALTAGFQAGFLACVIFTIIGIAIVVTLLRKGPAAQTQS